MAEENKNTNREENLPSSQNTSDVRAGGKEMEREGEQAEELER